MALADTSESRDAAEHGRKVDGVPSSGSTSLATSSRWPDHEGLYTPDDVLWQVNREAVLLLSGARALLMQIAHPLVAAGVAAKDDFRQDPIGRLLRTLRAMLGIIFSDSAAARTHAGRVTGAHRGVHGRLQIDTARYPAGTPYHALDPELLLWVKATLTDSALCAYECFVGPLSASQREAYYQDAKRMAPLLELPIRALPEDYAAFRDYVDEMLAGPSIEVTDEARELAQAVLHPPIAWLPDLAAAPLRFLSVGMLAPRLRRDFDLTWTAGNDRSWRTTCRLVRGIRRVTPDPLRLMPAARRAERALGAPR